MPSRTASEHKNITHGREAFRRQPLLSREGRLSNVFDSLTPLRTLSTSISSFVPEKETESYGIESRQLQPPAKKTNEKDRKRMSEPQDNSRAGSKRRSTKNETRWTTPGGTRKNRTIFTDEQHYALVAAYEADKYPTTIQKELLARQLGLAPIVVINWFQHRRQREPVKEKGGFVRNSPGNSRQGSPYYMSVSGMDVDGLESGSVPSINEYFANGTKTSNDIIMDDTRTKLSPSAEAGPPSIPGLPPISTSTAPATSATTQVNDTTSQSGTPVTPTSSNGQKSQPYYGRMQTVRAPLPGETRPASNGTAYPKPLNSHVGTIRWELDPLYIAPYIDHGFKDAMLPKDPNAFMLRPSSAFVPRK